MPTLQGSMTDGVPIIGIRMRQRQDESYVETSDLIASVENGADEIFLSPRALSSNGFRSSPQGTDYLEGFDVEIAFLRTGEELSWIAMRAEEVQQIPFPGCDATLGWPFLQKCVLVLDGPNQKYSLTW